MMSDDFNLDYSIIICSFNPDERILKRCLYAVSNLNFEGIKYEIILVDNNSTPPLNTSLYVQDFLNTKESKYIIAHEQGLTHARIKGIESAIGKYIVFFDDDNEPKRDYLANLKTLHLEHPNVAAWGPGDINVEFIDGIDSDIEKSTINYTKKAFQERHENYLSYASIRNWQACYPYGTGLCIKHHFLRGYALKAKAGAFNASGRKGNLLSSGEDLQMVLFCINNAAAAGVSPTLKINHLIPKKKANFDYLKNLTFGTNLSFHTCISEVLAEYKFYLQQSYIPTMRFSKKVLSKYVNVLFRKDQVKVLELIKFISLTCGNYIALNKPIPKTAKLVLHSLGINTKNLPI